MSCEIPCQCGASVTARLGDAGRRIPCSCGQTVEVPKYTVLRKLVETPVTRDDPETVRRRLMRGRMTLAGLGILMLATDAMIFWQLKNFVPHDGGTHPFAIALFMRAMVLLSLFGLAMTGRLWPRVWLILGLILSCLYTVSMMADFGFATSVLLYSIGAHALAVGMLMFIKTNSPTG